MYSCTLVFRTNKSAIRKVTLRKECRYLCGDPEEYSFKNDVMKYRVVPYKFVPEFVYDEETKKYNLYIVYIAELKEDPAININIMVLDDIIKQMVEKATNHVKFNHVNIVFNKIDGVE